VFPVFVIPTGDARLVPLKPVLAVSALTVSVGPAAGTRIALKGFVSLMAHAEDVMTTIRA